jgi:hypothetical protein
MRSTVNGGRRVVVDDLIYYVDAANPVSYISGDTLCNDLSVTKSNSTVSNGVLYDTDDKGAWLFDGIDDKIVSELKNPFNFDVSDPFSIDLWFNPVDTSINSILVSKWKPNDGVTTARGYYFGLILLGSPSRIKLRFSFFKTNIEFIATNIEEVISDNTWYHAVLTYDGSGNASGVNFYLDGSLRTKTVTRDNLISPATTDVNLQVGGQGNPTVGFFGFNGYISNAKVYNRELTSSEVLINYNVLKYRFR